METPPMSEKWKASLGSEEIDLESFSRILAIYTGKDGKKKSAWVPVSFAENEVVRKSLKVVKPQDLRNIEHPNILPASVLTADTPLNEAEIRFFTRNSTNYYLSLEEKLKVLDKVGGLTPEVIAETIQELIERCQKSGREYHPIRKVPHTKSGNSFNPNYESKIEDIPLDELETKIDQKLRRGFKEMKYEVYPEMNLDPEKFEAFANIFTILFRSVQIEMNKVERKWNALSAKELGLDNLKRHIKREIKKIEKELSSVGNDDEEDSINEESNIEKLGTKIQNYKEALIMLDQDQIVTEKTSRYKRSHGYIFYRNDIYRKRAIQKKFPLIQNGKPLIWTQFLNYLGLSKKEWNILGDEGKFEREWSKIGALAYPDLESWFYSWVHREDSSQKTFTLRVLFYNIFRTPELCGFIKYLNLLDPEIIETYTDSYTHLYHERTSAFELLAKEEQRFVLDPETEIDGNEGFIFPIDGLHILSIENILNDIWKILEKYTDGILEHLDLTQCVLTGSAITAAVGIPFNPNYFDYEKRPIDEDDEDDYPPGKDFDRDLKVFFPSSITVPSSYERYREIIEKGGYRIFKDQLILGKEHVGLKFEDGADIDLAVLADTDREFEEIVQTQYQKLKAWNPKLKLVKIDRKSLLYEIQGHSRKIQLYPSNLKQILTHHLAMVRGFVYGNGEDRMIYCSASAMYSFYQRISLNYYYFAGLKSPAEVILKYYQRGYKVNLPKDLKKLINRYAKEATKWNRERINILIGNPKLYFVELLSQVCPAIFGYGNFDISDLSREEKEFQRVTEKKFSEFATERKTMMNLLGENGD